VLARQKAHDLAILHCKALAKNRAKRYMP